MIITTTSLMNYLMSQGYHSIKVIYEDTIKNIKEVYGEVDGEEILKKLKESGLYEEERQNFFTDYSELMINNSFNLSANFFEEMGTPITGEQFREYIPVYMEKEEMWPLRLPIDTLYDYSINIALPKFVAAGLLEVY